MLAANTKSTGTSYTGTVALLVIAFILIPAILIISRPFGPLPLALAVLSSVICTVLARMSWTQFSQLSIPSVASQQDGTP